MSDSSKIKMADTPEGIQGNGFFATKLEDVVGPVSYTHLTLPTKA